MTIDTALAVRLADEILRYRRVISEELYEKGRVDPEDARILADLRDYFMYLALRADESASRELVNLFEKLEAQAEKAKDRFHAGFFFTLSQLMSLRYEIARLPGEKITFEEWYRSFEETLRKVGIPPNPAWDDLAASCPKCGSLRARTSPALNEAWCESCLHHWRPVSFWTN